MFRIVVLFAAVLLLLNGFAPPYAPVTWLADTTYEFGDIRQGKEVKVVFAFRNASADSLYIDNVRTSCGCTSPSWEDVRVPPDSIGRIDIFYDADETGYFSKDIKVYFNGYRRAERLLITGYVEP
ncbi:MAG: DUF1573 domain-containing protein [Bacteroidetes bacterium]|nr:MAG: DUF1573 domain-containing protein [Bacteroidota bacterium]PTM08748.1 MAG: DUF1573 domain-containing protein [Bacteroidota bacterium]